MPKPPSSPPDTPAWSALQPDLARRDWLPWALVAAVTLAYLSSFGGVFVFDDHQAIVENPTLRDGWRIDRLLLLPGNEAGTVGGRPVANLTFALNFALSGIEPWSYHLLNLVIHALATVVLFAVLRRTFQQPALRGLAGSHARALAGVCALLWGLHPLQTESVTYVVQRVESLTGLWYLLTLLCFIRAVDTHGSRRWPLAAFACCLAGMATKETMVSAPLFLLLYDRAFYSATWREIWHRRRRLHGALLGTWLLLALLVAGTAGRGGSAGFGVGLDPWTYLLTQSEAIVHYLRLVVWPHPLVFDYGTAVVDRFAAVWWQLLLLAGLCSATVWAAIRRPLLALPGAWFFLILAPSSSVVPIATQTLAEHRMYLPLAAVVVAGVLALHRWKGPRIVIPLVAVSVALGWMTHRRNLVYHSELALWADTVSSHPENFRAHTTLGFLRAEQGETEAAVRHYEDALRIAPDNAPTHLNLSAALLTLGRAEQAWHHAAQAVRLEPGNTNAQVNLGNALVDLGRVQEAIAHYNAAWDLEPDAEDVNLNLASAWLQQGNAAGAVRYFTAAARINPDRARTWHDLARAELMTGNREAAGRAVAGALRRAPDDAENHFLAGNVAASREDLVTALRHFRRAVALNAEFIAARNNLANALLISGQVDEAIDHYREVLRQNPSDQRVQENLTNALQLRGPSHRAP